MVWKYVFGRQQLTLADKVKLGNTERLSGGFKAVHQVSFGKSEGDNHEGKKTSAESGWWLLCRSRRGSFLGCRLQDLVHSGVDIQHLIIFDTLNVCELVKTKSLTKQFQNLRHISMWLNIETLYILTKGSITSVCQENQKLWRRLYLPTKGNITPPYMIEITCVWWYVFSIHITVSAHTIC